MARIPSPAVARSEEERKNALRLRITRRVAKLTEVTGRTDLPPAARYLALHASPTVFKAILTLMQSTVAPTPKEN